MKALLDKIQPDMIALDPDFVGSLAPEVVLSTASGEVGAGAAAGVGGRKGDIPFARLPRLERLRVQGKADETEEVSGDEGEGEGGDGEDGEGKKAARHEEKEKKKMRGRNKALKRYVLCPPLPLPLILFPVTHKCMLHLSLRFGRL